MADPLDVLTRTIDEASRRHALAAQRRKLQDEFEALDTAAVMALSDKALAAWQAGFDAGSPQWRLAEFAWQSRLLAREVEAIRSAANRNLWGALAGACVGVAGSIAVALVTWWVGRQ